MPKRMLLALAAASVALVALGPPAAHAATCPKPAAADVTFDGIVLSGPRLGVTGDVLSPARLQVVRYVKGHGPRIVRVATGFRQGLRGLGMTAGPFTPEPGEVVRIFGRTPGGAGSSTARGVLEPSTCGSFRVLDPRRYLHALGRTRTVARSTQGGTAWSAEPLSGPDGLLCVRFQPTNRTGAIDRQAECQPRPGAQDPLVGIAATSQGASTTTAVVVAGRRLRSVSLDSPDGRIDVRALGSRLPMAVAVFRGFVDPTQLELRATFAHGRAREVELASRRADVPDPSGQPGWAVFGQDAYPHVTGGSCAAWWQPLPRLREIAAAPLPDQACGRLGRAGLWFAVRSSAAGPAPGDGGPADRTVVTGAVGPRVAGVTVSARGVTYPVGLARFGRAFLAVLPSGVAEREITVAFRLGDGSTRTYTGRAQLGVLHIRRDAL